MKFWESERYKDAHLSKIELPDEAIQKINNWIKGNRDMLVFLSNSGVGKTYFCAAYIHHLLETKREFRCFHESELFKAMRDTMSQGWDYERELERLCEARYFILDDMGSSQLTEFQKEILTNFINLRYNSRLPTVITSNIYMHNMGNILSERIKSRLLSKDNTLIEMAWIDKRLDRTPLQPPKKEES